METQSSRQRPPGLPIWDPYWRSIRRLSQLRGMPVIDLSRAHRVGYILDVFINPSVRRLSALAVGPSGEFRQDWVAGTHVRRIGRNAVVIQASEDKAEIADPGESDDSIDSKTLNGLEVLADNGDRVGYVSDVYLNPDTLAVQAFELSTPLWERWLRGRRLVKPDGMLLCSRELMIVPSHGRTVTAVDLVDDSFLERRQSKMLQAVGSERDDPTDVVPPPIARSA